MSQLQRPTDQVANFAEEFLKDDIRFLLKKCIETETDKDNTPPSSISVASFCTYVLRYNELPPVNEHFAGGEFEGNSNVLRLEIEMAPTPAAFDWLSFCGDLFPGARGYTEEESQAYQNFLNAFFETIEI